MYLRHPWTGILEKRLWPFLDAAQDEERFAQWPAVIQHHHTWRANLVRGKMITSVHEFVKQIQLRFNFFRQHRLLFEDEEELVFGQAVAQIGNPVAPGQQVQPPSEAEAPVKKLFHDLDEEEFLEAVRFLA